MPLVTMSRERMAREARKAAERLAETAAAEREARRRLAAYFLAWLGCYAAGVVLAFSSLAVRTDDLGGVLMWGGLALGNVGGFFVWIVWLVNGTNRGEL